MEQTDLVIHAKWILPCEIANQILEQHALVILQGKIAAILPSKEAKATYAHLPQQFLENHALLPGFINSHTHIAMNAFRGLADDIELMDWLNNYIWPAETKWLSQELVYDASLLAMAEMIRGGTTCFNDMYFFMDATAKAAEQAGMRAHIGMTVIGVPTPWAKTTEEYFAKGIAFYERYKNHLLITPTLAPHSTYTVDIKDLERVKRLADDYHLKTNVHLQEAPIEITNSMAQFGKRPLQRLNEIGMVNEDLIAIHMTQLDEADLALLKTKKPSIVHCPESNMKLVSGSCPVAKLNTLNINVALGTDGAASNNDLDMIGEMRTASFLGKVTANNPAALPATDLLQMATIHGAKALGIDQITGTLTPGKSADCIAIDLSWLETQPVYHPISQIVYAGNRRQVSDVWVAGKQLLKNSHLTTLDEKEILKKAQFWGNKINN